MDKPIYEIPLNGSDGPTVGADFTPYPPPNPLPSRTVSYEPPLVPPSNGHAAMPPDPFPSEQPAATASYPPPASAPQPMSAGLFPPPAVTRAAYDAPAMPQMTGTPALPQSNLAAADPDLLAALQDVVLSGASDLHVTINAAPMIRVDGALRPVAGTDPWNRDKVAKALHSLLTPSQLATFETELELDFAYTISANARFRVNFYQQRGAIGGAFRLIPTEIKQLADLGVPDVVARFATLARGLVLITGPTGSGKSTTLAALIDLVNRTRADHIVTVEDPIEFLHGNQMALVNQREVGADTHSFAAALKHVLRQDPDVILIGELRDLETISVALTAAETGHLVFATLHTQDAAQTVDRVIDVFPPHQQGQIRAQLAATLQGVVCQTLVKRASGRGRAVATEVLVTTPAIANLIREGKTYQMTSSMQAGRELGMHTMDQHLADLVNSGQITHQAALEKVHDADSFDRLVLRVETPMKTSSPSSSGPDFDSYSGRN